MIVYKGIKHPELNKALAKGLAVSIDGVAEDCNRYCKWDSGETYRSMRPEKETDYRWMITWNTPYAGYAYYKGNPQYRENPDAHLRWAHHAERLHGGQWQQEIAQNVLKLLRG